MKASMNLNRSALTLCMVLFGAFASGCAAETSTETSEQAGEQEIVSDISSTEAIRDQKASGSDAVPSFEEIFGSTSSFARTEDDPVDREPRPYPWKKVEVTSPYRPTSQPMGGTSATQAGGSSSSGSTGSTPDNNGSASPKP